MSRQDYRHGILIFLVLSFSIAAWMIILHYFSPEELVRIIGISNGYLVVFLIALFGGVSSFTGVSFVAAILTFSSGGLNPALLALASGVGVTLSDTLFYVIGRHAHHVVENATLQHIIERVSIWLNDRSPLVIGLCIYVYTGFTPLPTDILTIMLGLTKQPYIFVVTTLALGNITFTYLLATAGTSFFGFL